MVVVEAMACGLPVIVSDMVGARQLVEEGEMVSLCLWGTACFDEEDAVVRSQFRGAGENVNSGSFNCRANELGQLPLSFCGRGSARLSSV
jgi:glycosyltransferase involved in cell wall biosynthesis